MKGRGLRHVSCDGERGQWPERHFGGTDARLASAGDGDLAVAIWADARPRALVSSAVAIAVVSAIAGGLALLPAHAVAPDGRGALEATLAVSAIVTACLLIANWKRGRSLPDILLLGGVVVLSLADFVYLGLPALKEMSGLESSNALWLGCELVAALAIAAAALADSKPALQSRRELVKFEVAVGAGAIVLGPVLALVIGASGLHTGTGAAADDPVAISVHASSAAILLAAAVAFLARFPRADGRSVLISLACLLLAGVDLRYLAAPAVHTDWVTPREGARLAAYGLLLAGAYLRHAQLQRNAAFAAISSERERIARDLHDGLAQDLACIAAQGQRLDCQLGPEHPLMVATRHALAASRGVIVDLTASAAPTTEAALRMVADELEHRYDVQVNVRVETDAALSPADELEADRREDLVRIAREAIVNAALHGTARHVDVVLLRRQGTLLMRVSDDGRGIHDAQHSGFGLRSMRARAASLGGQLSAHPRAGGGTDLELLVS